MSYIRLTLPWSLTVLSLILTFIIGFSVQVTSSYAQEQQTEGKMHILANMGVYNISASQHTPNSALLAFDIQNDGTVSQSDIWYGVEVVDDTGKRHDVVFSPETLSLGAGNAIHKEFSYETKVLSGTYDLRVFVQTSSGLLLGVGAVEDVTFTSDTLPLVVTACDSAEGVMKCTIENTLAYDVAVTPVFETYATDVFGNPVDTKKSAELIVNAGDTSLAVYTLPQNPGRYVTKVSLVDSMNSTLAPTFFAHSFAPGKHVTIQNAYIDKETYNAGDVLKMTTFIALQGIEKESVLTGTLTVMDGQGDACIDPFSLQIPLGLSPLTFETSVIKACDVPHVLYTISDAEGTTLAEMLVISPAESVEESVVQVEEKVSLSYIYITALITIIALLILLFLLRKVRHTNSVKDSNDTTMTTPEPYIKSLILGLMLAGSLFGGVGEVSAVSWSNNSMAAYCDGVGGCGGAHGFVQTLNANKTTYAPGETVSLSGSVTGTYVYYGWLTGWNPSQTYQIRVSIADRSLTQVTNTVNGYTYTYLTDGSEVYDISNATPSITLAGSAPAVNASPVPAGATQTWNVSGSFSAPSTPGTYTLIFESRDYPDDCCVLSGGLGSVTFTVVASTPPSQPTMLAPVCSADGTSITLRWNSVSASPSPAYAYRMDDATTGTNPDYHNNSGTNITQILINSIVPGRTYSWWVHAVNANGWSGSTAVNVSCPAPTPTNGTCGSSNGGSFSSAPASNLCNAGGTSWTDSTASDGSYNWQCTGSNGGTTASCSATKTVTGTAPATPSTPNAVTGASCGGTVDISWSSVSGATSYTLRRGTTVIYTGPNLSYTDTSLTSGTSYSYTVRAENSYGNSVYSSSDSATASAVCATATNGSCSATLDTCTAGTWRTRSDLAPNYRWYCDGINGGTNASCSIPMPACSDSQDNDSDGLTDYPNDPGCTSSSDTDETNTPPASATITAPDCTITAGNSSCTSSVSWSSTNASSPSVRQNGTQFSTSASNAGTSRTLTYVGNPHSFTFSNSGTQLAIDTASAVCASGTSWNGSVCVASALPNLTSSIVPTVSGTLTQDQSVTFSGRVRNSGSGTLNSSFWDNFTYRWGLSGSWTEVSQHSKSSGLVAGGTYIDTSSSFTLSNSGNLQIQHCVDSQWQISESDESDTDNCEVVTFTVASAPSVTATVNATDCSISAGNDRCDSTVSWISSNTTAPSVRQDGTEFSTLANSGSNQLRSIIYGAHTFTFYNSGSLVTSDAGTASCAGGTRWNGTSCVQPTGSITADPSEINGGDTTTLTWSSNDATSCTVSSLQNSDAWTALADVVGQQSSALMEDTTYILNCDGVLVDSVDITVNIIPVLTSTKRIVEQGDDTTLTWEVFDQVCTLVGGSLNMTVTEDGSTPVTVEANTTYTLTCPGGVDTVRVEIVPRGFET